MMLLMRVDVQYVLMPIVFDVERYVPYQFVVGHMFSIWLVVFVDICQSNQLAVGLDVDVYR